MWCDSQSLTILSFQGTLAKRSKPTLQSLLIGICHPILSNRGFVITFIPVQVKVFVFNIT